MTDTPLADFYAGRRRDFAGRSIDDIWAMPLDELEYNHDYIQWLFPLRERSGVEPNVPVIGDDTVAAFEDPDLHARLARSARVMAAFYGFEIVDDGRDVRVRRQVSFEERRRVWLTPGNHNFLRQTRIVKSLATLGHPRLAAAWLDELLAIAGEYASVIGPVTVRYWRDALRIAP
jgi:hypothetical protein